MVDHKDTPAYAEIRRRQVAEQRQLLVLMVVAVFAAGFALGVLAV